MSNKLNTGYYLTPEFISKIKGLDLKARFIVEGFMIGLHKSPYHGFSAEFSEHRQYLPGDELNKIDWKVFAKTEKYFLKQYEDETNLRAHILLDKSLSMAYTSQKITKFEYAQSLAAALIFLIKNQNDAVGLGLFSDYMEKYMSPKSSKNYMMEILKTLATTVPSNKTNTLKAIKSLADSIKKQGLIIILSDFLDNSESIIAGLKQFRFKKNEVIVFHILDPMETKFNFDKDYVFKDKETDDTILTQTHQIKNSYINAFTDYQKYIQKECRNNQIDYYLISTDFTYDKALLAYLKKRNKLN